MISMTNQTETYEFEVGAGAEISVGNVAGSIEIAAGETGSIHVVAEKRGSEQSQENTRIDTVQDGDRVTIRTENHPVGLLGSKRLLCEVHYRISVPKGCAVEANGVSADISVMDTGAPVKVHGISGNVRVVNVADSCSVTVVSGDVRVENARCTLTVHSTSGDVQVLASELESLNAHSVSGDVAVDSPLLPGQHYFGKTVSGDFVLTVPRNTGATLQLKTVSGEVVSELPAQIIKSGRRHWQGRIGSGEANVELTSVSGDLRVLAGDRLAPASESAAGVDDEAHSAAVNAVLKLLEEGEIEVEDAMTRIKTLGSQR